MCRTCNRRSCNCTIIYKNTTTQAINREAVFASLAAGEGITLDYNVNNGQTIITSSTEPINLIAGDNITIDQVGDDYTINASGGDFTSNNGLTLTGSNFQLGGELINGQTKLFTNTSLYKNFYIDLKNPTSQKLTGFYVDNDGYADLWAYNDATNTKANLRLFPNNAHFFAEDINGKSELNLGNSSNTFRDDRYFVGLSYTDDYSANNTLNDRWIVDKGYVDNTLLNVVHLAGTETITGHKIFSDWIKFTTLDPDFVDIDGYKVHSSNGVNYTDIIPTRLVTGEHSSSRNCKVQTDRIKFTNATNNTVEIIAPAVSVVNRTVDIPDASGVNGVIGTTAPASAVATGVVGEIRVTSTFVYTCIAPNTWVRSVAATW